MKEILIIGNGISGITAARHIRKMSDHAITVVSDETDHFFSRTALMYIYMGHMQYEHTKPYEDWFWEKSRIALVRDRVLTLDTTSRQASTAAGKTIRYDILIIATGSKPRAGGWPGEDLAGVQGLYSYPDLQRMEDNTKHINSAVVVGGGLIGIEMVEMLMSRNIPVTFIVREDSFWNTALPPEESNMVNRHIREHGVDLRLSTQLRAIEGDSEGRVRAVVIDDGGSIDCEFVGLTIGVTPAIDFVKESGIEVHRGVLVNRYFETNIDDVYAIGDCAEFSDPIPGRKSVEQIWYTGRMHGETVARTICGNRTVYEPGPWFNSAKFFDIEYQVYGTVGNSPGKDGEHIYWEHANGRHAVRFAFDNNTSALMGINLMGVRYRHFVCDQWIRSGAGIREVLTSLDQAAFDPEFFDDYSHELIDAYNRKHPDAPVPVGRGRSGNTNEHA